MRALVKLLSTFWLLAVTAPAIATTGSPILPTDRDLANQINIIKIDLGSSVPEEPIAGEVAQLHLGLQILPYEALDRAEIARAVTKRLHLTIDGQEIPLDQALSFDRLEDTGKGTWLAETTLTFSWPETMVSRLGFSRTETQVLEVGQGTGSARLSSGDLGPIRRVVTVHSEVDALLLVAFVAGIAVYVSLLIVLYRRWVRRRAERRIGVSRSIPTPADDPSEDPATDAALPALPTPFVDTTPPSIPPVPSALAKAVASKEAVLMAGALASQGGPATWSEIALDLIQRFGGRDTKTFGTILTDPDPQGALARTARDIGGRDKVIEAVIASAPRDELLSVLEERSHRDPSPLQMELIRLPWRAIVDCNLGDRLERAYAAVESSGDPPVVVTVHDQVPGSQLHRARGRERIIIKPYGSFARPATVALTAEEMRRNFNRAPDFARLLSAMLQGQPFVFVGLEPETIIDFFQAVAGESDHTVMQHFALVPDDPASALLSSTLARYGVQLVSFDPRLGEDGLLDFGRELTRRSRRLEPDASSETLSILARDRISRVRLENIGPFAELELSISDGSIKPTGPVTELQQASGSPWWVLFGGNGVGKSSILRSIAVVLAGDLPASAAAGSRLLRVGQQQGLIEVQLGSRTLRTRLSRERSTVRVESAQRTPVQFGASMALGFPALRGARAPNPSGPKAVEELRVPEPADLQALIGGEVDGRLADFKQWLVNILVKAKEDPRAEQMRELLSNIIREIIPGKIHALAPIDGTFEIRISTPDGDVPFDDLSQGMASIFNWVGVLVQRLFTICEDSERPQDEPAIVIVDEIDAHLHPEWQRRLVLLTRKFFPNVQVIATSHSPLLAGSLRAFEMCVLERDLETGKVGPAVGVGESFGLPSQDILTSPVFAMSSDRSVPVERLIRDYFTIFEKPERSREEEQELQRLSGVLEHYRYGTPGPVDLTPPDAASLELLKTRLRSAQEGAP